MVDIDTNFLTQKTNSVFSFEQVLSMEITGNPNYTAAHCRFCFPHKHISPVWRHHWDKYHILRHLGRHIIDCGRGSRAVIRMSGPYHFVVDGTYIFSGINYDRMYVKYLRCSLIAWFCSTRFELNGHCVIFVMALTKLRHPILSDWEKTVSDNNQIPANSPGFALPWYRSAFQHTSTMM